jgi:hypothetical protein
MECLVGFAIRRASLALISRKDGVSGSQAISLALPVSNPVDAMLIAITAILIRLEKGCRSI